jgi:6-phosphogluconolactonase
MYAMESPIIDIQRDPEQLALAASERIIQSANEVIRARGRFTLVLSGGSTPEKTYAHLSSPQRESRIDWSKTYLFFGDERVVPHDDARSNYHMAKRSLLDKIPIPADHVFPIPTDKISPAENAVAYAQSLAKFFGIPIDGKPPRFDLILLGLGDDGHTASLFPEADALKENRAWVTWSPPGTLPPPVDRVTLTFPALHAAREVLFLVAGANKAAPLREVVEGHAPPERRPAAGIVLTDGKVAWLIDKAAARLLSSA